MRQCSVVLVRSDECGWTDLRKVLQELKHVYLAAGQGDRTWNGQLGKGVVCVSEHVRLRECRKTIGGEATRNKPMTPAQHKIRQMMTKGAPEPVEGVISVTADGSV